MTDKIMRKKSYVTMMTYEVSDAEKMQAERALIYFNASSKLLDAAANHLDIMKTPFKDNPNISPDEIMKARAAIRRFRDKSVDNFNEFKMQAFKCVNVMQEFSSDTQVVKLMKSFISSINELEASVNQFVDLFNDLESKDFVNDIVEKIEDIQKKCEDIIEIIEERIKKHIQTNILATSWVDSVGDEMQLKIEKKTPLILDLFNKRQDQLNDVIKEKTQIGS